MNEDYNLSYIPPKTAPQSLNATIGVKFSNDIFLSVDMLKKWDIPYKEEDLEQTPLGLRLRIKRE